MLDIAPLGRALFTLRKEIEKDAKNARFSTVIALTKTGKLAQTAVLFHMLQVIDKPTRFTLNSTFVKPATIKNPEVTVGLKEGVGGVVTDPDKYLGPLQFGGPRAHKRFERALIARGIMGTTEYAVPGKGVRLNTFGNISRGLINKILSDLGAQRITDQNATRQGQRYFVGGRGRAQHLPRGIFERRGKRILAIMIFVRAPVYQKRLQFEETIQATFDRYLESEYTREFNRKIKGAGK